ncbi:MAG: hypothetical protein FVQ80_14450 [Planctomycetes bacterium]|nr:hypothetical protein [Planctomycetota bacterium]
MFNIGTLLESGFWRAVGVSYILLMLILAGLARYYMFKIRRYVYMHRQEVGPSTGSGQGGSKIGLFRMPIINDAVYTRLRVKMYGCYIGYAVMGVAAVIAGVLYLFTVLQSQMDLLSI